MTKEPPACGNPQAGLLFVHSNPDLAAALFGDGDHGRTHRHVVLEIGPAGGQVLVIGRAAEGLPILAAIAGMLDRDEGCPYPAEAAGRTFRRRRARGRTASTWRALRLPYRRPRCRRCGRFPSANCRRWIPKAALRHRQRNCLACRTSHCSVVSVEKEAPTSATDGSPHFSRISQLPLVAAKSPPSR